MKAFRNNLQKRIWQEFMLTKKDFRCSKEVRMRNFLTFITLASIFFSFTCRAESIGIKIPNMLHLQSLSFNAPCGNFLINSFADEGVESSQPSISTYAWETIGGIGGGTLGLFVGAAGGIVCLLPFCLRVDPPDEDTWYLWGAAPIACLSAGLIFGTSFGISQTGKILGQNGSFKKTLLGTTIGTAAGVITYFTIRHYSPDADGLIPLYFSIPLPLIGGLIGYNL